MAILIGKNCVLRSSCSWDKEILVLLMLVDKIILLVIL